MNHSWIIHNRFARVEQKGVRDWAFFRAGGRSFQTTGAADLILERAPWRLLQVLSRQPRIQRGDCDEERRVRVGLYSGMSCDRYAIWKGCSINTAVDKTDVWRQSAVWLAVKGSPRSFFLFVFTLYYPLRGNSGSWISSLTFYQLSHRAFPFQVSPLFPIPKSAGTTST